MNIEHTSISGIGWLYVYYTSSRKKKLVKHTEVIIRYDITILKKKKQ